MVIKFHRHCTKVLFCGEEKTAMAFTDSGSQYPRRAASVVDEHTRARSTPKYRNSLIPTLKKNYQGLSHH